MNLSDVAPDSVVILKMKNVVQMKKCTSQPPKFLKKCIKFMQLRFVLHIYSTLSIFNIYSCNECIRNAEV